MVTTPTHLAAADPRTMLLIIPCSGRKLPCPGVQEDGPSILDEVPRDLADEMRRARESVRHRAHIDERTRVAAWRRYDGTLYKAAARALELCARRGTRAVIVSGGYGLLTVGEPIGNYEASFRPDWWPNRLLERVLVAYARRHGIRQVRAFASASTRYRRVVERTDWRAAGAGDAVLLIPNVPASTGAMVKTPRAQGEAVVALLEGRLDANWASSDGVHEHSLKSR